MKKKLNFQTKAIIAGRSMDAVSGKTFETLNPANGKILAKIARCEKADADIAVEAARNAFENGPWPKMSPAERKVILQRFATLIEAHTDELAELEAIEAGKPISDCIEIDLPETVGTIRWHAEAADKIYDQLSPSGSGVVSMIVREPIGVVAAILPWNFPLMMAAWKLGPILAEGNTVILKPAEQTSMSTIRLAQLATEAGIPDGVINVVPGFGEEVGKALGEHMGIDCVGFTGSTEIGRMFLRYSADSNLKRVLLECGGKNPLVVMPDAADLDVVADHAANSIFWNMGENCSSNSRVLIHSSLKAEFIELLLERTQDWVIADPLDSACRLGPLIEEDHMKKVLSHIEKAKKEGAKLICGGNRVMTESGGYFVEPTIFDEVSPKMSIAKEEIFGPVLAILTFETPEEGIAMANDTEYGLTASVFSASNKTAHNAARQIRAGTVSVNCYGEGDISTPFGGFGLSGFGGRDKSLAAHDQYCELKTIWMDMS
jgi:gamma-glutamyl-gamma-aminobutyraldehyde dehydrogenase|tara:strand:+ start:2043 stop:3509 length:1467 start_codon:yes stop_codon:yes gene_type:complete